MANLSPRSNQHELSCQTTIEIFTIGTDPLAMDLFTKLLNHIDFKPPNNNNL